MNFPFIPVLWTVTIPVLCNINFSRNTYNKNTTKAIFLAVGAVMFGIMAFSQHYFCNINIGANDNILLYAARIAFL